MDLGYNDAIKVIDYVKSLTNNNKNKTSLLIEKLEKLQILQREF